MNPRVSILHVIKSLGRGGAEMLLPETLRLHDHRKFEFHYIYFLPWKNQMVDSLEKYGGKVTCLEAKNNIELILRAKDLADYVKRHDIKLLHAHLPWAGIVCRIVGRMTGIPVVYTEHNKQERYHFLTRWANLATMNWLTRVVAVSDDVAASLKKHKSGLKAKLQTILNGVNTQHYQRDQFDRMAARHELRIPDGAEVIGTVAVFRFQKRLDVWMEVANKILEKHPDTHFVILGDGPLKQQLLQKRQALGLEERIHMPGLMTEVRPYLAAMDVYMMSSVFEGLPIALLEAMSMECPIVTTDAGGIKEVIRHETDGLMCSVDQPMELVLHASTLLEDVRRREKLGQTARVRIKERFSLSHMVGELERMYVELLAL